MSEALEIINNAAVSIFGCVLSGIFCGLGKSKRGRLEIAAITAILLAVQSVYYLLMGNSSIRNIYPLLTHLPLFIALCLLTREPVWSCGSVLLAYLCCQLRRWVALCFVWVINGGDTALAVTEIIITAPILILLIIYIAPTVLEIHRRNRRAQVQFFLIPVLYYVYDYLTTVYTDWLYSGTPAVVEFMPFVCCAVYLIFMMRFSEEERRYSALERDRDSLHIQVSQSVRELEGLRQAQEQYTRYRHDLRHHLQYLSSCIENEEYDRALGYINGISQEIAARKVVVYCENEPVNLVLSAYAGRAAKLGVQMDVRVALGGELEISENDLCVLLSNGLENALKACSEIKAENPQIRVRGYERSGRIYLQISNPCPEGIAFENGLPVANREGHGIGTRSIMAIVEGYGGVCSFSVEDGQFILRASL